MDYIAALLLGIIQGALEFLPVSSSGHLVVLERSLGLDTDGALLFGTFVHMGSALAIVRILRKDMRMLTGETIRMTGDVLGNFGKLISGRGKDSAYMKVTRTSYRRLSLLLFTAFVPTMVIGALLEGVAREASGSLLFTGTGFLITGLILMVTGRVKERKRTPHEFPLPYMAAIGAAQGVSVLPGISRAGLVWCGGILGGFSKKTALRVSYLLCVETSIAAFIFELMRSAARGSLDAMALETGVIGLVASYISARIFGKRLLRFVSRTRTGVFAIWTLCMGLLALVMNFI